MAQTMLTPRIPSRYIDKRRLMAPGGFTTGSTTVGIPIFTCNAAGTTTTAVGANAAPGTNDNNVIRRGESFKLFTAAGVAKEETIFRVTGVAVGASTTVTFTPAAGVATANTDVLKRVGPDQMDDISDLDFRLNQLDSTTYTQAKLDGMTANDKVYALRSLDDVGSLP